MAGIKSLGVLLAVAAVLATVARAVDDEHMYHWKCFKSCTGNCRDEDAVSVDVGVVKDGGHYSGDSNNVSSSVSGGGGKCKDKCLGECFVEDLPAICYQKCVVNNCLHCPPFSKEKTTCLKSCCDKCFPKPKPPAPKPKPPAPQPKPNPPAPKPKPTPCPTPKPKPKPKPPAPKAPPSPKKPCPCPPGSDKANNN